jgi:hypothetical protein
MEETSKIPLEYSIIDGDYHRALVEITPYSFLVILLDTIRDVMESVRIMVLKHPGNLETVVAGIWTWAGQQQVG